MGSGLILFVIVGAWLAVLVPMALKSHDTSASLRSVDRFGDAMRVLSRRTPGDRREVLLPPAPAPLLEPLGEPLVLTAAERRRRTLSVLVGLALVTLGLALVGPAVLLALHLVIDALLAAFLVHCRRQAVRRAATRRAGRRDPVEQARAERPERRRPVAPAAAAPTRVAGIPDRMPARPAPLTAPLPAPAARYEDPVPVVAPAAAAATGTDDGWSPVPVPPPVYVGKPVAPSRPPRVLDLTRPGEWAATLEDAGLDILDEGPELDDILERRRVSGGW